MTQIFTGIFAGPSPAPKYVDASFLNHRGGEPLVSLLEAGCTLIQALTKSGEIIGFSLVGFSKCCNETCGEILFTFTWKKNKDKIFASLWEASRLYCLEQGAKRVCLWIPCKEMEESVDYNKVTLLDGKTIGVRASGTMIDLTVEQTVPWKKQWLHIAKNYNKL